MKLLVPFFIFFLSIKSCFPQDITHSPIVISKNFLGVDLYKQNDKKLSFKKINRILASNDSAYAELKIAKRNKAIGSFIGVPGGMLTGLFMEGMVKGNPGFIAPFVTGGILLLVSVPYDKAFKNHTKKAVLIYNRSLERKAEIKPNLNP